MKYLIVGLGNIGAEYADTRHNIGFVVVDRLAQAEGLSFVPDRYASVCEYKLKGKTLVMIKPSTYMNLSGKAVNYWLQTEKIPVENMLVIVDDLALPFGAIRMKASGSSAGHNGLENINETLGHQNWSRLRFGIGSEFSKGKQVDYVLGQWNETEREALTERTDKMVDAIKSFALMGMQKTMGFFNGK